MVDPLSYSFSDFEEDFSFLEKNVPRGTFESTYKLLKTYVEGLIKWQKTINLVGPDTLASIWDRHILDSAQLLSHIPRSATSILDMGSGAGLPGLILAILLRENQEVTVHLVESDQRKSAFLRQMSAELDLNTQIHSQRLEKVLVDKCDVITARALAPVKDLLDYAHRFSTGTTLCLFLKGQNVVVELTEATKYWKMNVSQYESMTDNKATILAIEDFHRV